MAGNNEPKKIFLEILDQLKAQIISGELKAGDKLPSERMLAEKLCVGRPSVREAIRALETLGLLRCVQGDGNYLADDLKNSLVEPMVFMFALSGGNLITAQQLREALELETAALAAQRRTDADIAALRSLAAQIESTEVEQRRAELDSALHYLIADIAGNPLIISTLNASSYLIEQIITETRISIMNKTSSVNIVDLQHRALIDAIAAGDLSESVNCMRAHMALITDYALGLPGENK